MSSWRRRTCAAGLRQPYVNASVWPYVAGHIVLVARLLTVEHSPVDEVFREGGPGGQTQGASMLESRVSFHA